MIDWNKPVRTVGDHCPVEIWTTDDKSSTVYVVRGVFKYEDHWRRAGWTIDGQLSTKNTCHHDLENIPDKIVQYVNFYPNYSISRKEADKMCRAGRIACVRVEYDEGQFDE